MVRQFADSFTIQLHEMKSGTHFDAIVVGAGSAGCVTASRLSAAGLRTLLLEAGPDKLSFWQRLPLGVGRALKDPAHTWVDACQPTDRLGGRRLEWHAGRGLGGSSAVNGMLAVRGDPGLYAQLADYGIHGWSYDECLPHFKSIETVRFNHGSSRGGSGPITVSRIPFDRFSLAFHAAFNAMGMESGDDYNDTYKPGVYQLQLTASRYRRSDASRYLSLVANRANLTFASESLAHQLLVQEGRVRGLRVLTREGHEQDYGADYFFLCLGAVRTPTILERSGIGDPRVIERAGLQARHELVSVGANLKDHVMIRQTFESRYAGTVNNLFLSKGFAAVQAARYLAGNYSLFGTSSLVSTAFVPLSPGDHAPRFRVQLGLGSAEGRLSTDLKTGIDAFSGFHFGVYDISPTAAGSVHIGAKGGGQHHVIENNYLEGGGDLDRLKQAFSLLDELASEPAMREVIRRRTRPDGGVNTPEEAARYFAKSAHTCWHPVGTCRMGSSPADSVTSSRGRVHGIDNLFIHDASIFPIHTSSNTNLPVMMAAEKLSAEFLNTR
jgi:choline dehydrogenase